MGALGLTLAAQPVFVPFQARSVALAFPPLFRAIVLAPMMRFCTKI